MTIEHPHVVERLGSDHVSWCLNEPWHQLRKRVEMAREAHDDDLAWCYEQVCVVKKRYENMAGATA